MRQTASALSWLHQLGEPSFPSNNEMRYPHTPESPELAYHNLKQV